MQLIWSKPCNICGAATTDLHVTQELDKFDPGGFTSTYKDRRTYICSDACREKFDLAEKDRRKLSSAAAAYLMRKGLTMLLVPALVMLMFFAYAMWLRNEHAWQTEGTKANRIYLKSLGKPCDFEVEQNCEIS